MPDDHKIRGPRAVTRVLDLFSTLAAHKDGLTLAQLSAELGVPKPTLLDTLRGLLDKKYLTQTETGYRLGGGAHRMAARIMDAWSPPDALRREVKSLADLSRESVGFAIADWELCQVIYTEAINSTRVVRYSMRQGIRAPFYASAAGRVILAFSAPQRVQAYLARGPFKAMTVNTRVTAAAIEKNLSEIRKQGFCASFGEMLPDTAAVAAPVFDQDGLISGAMMLAAPIERMREHADDYQTALVDACRRASSNGWRHQAHAQLNSSTSLPRAAS